VHARDMIKANGGRYLAAGDATTYVGERPNLVWPYSSLTTSSKYKLATKLSEPWAKSTPNSATTPSQEFHSRVTTIEDMIHFPLPG
jgi:hypothetical protein